MKASLLLCKILQRATKRTGGLMGARLGRAAGLAPAAAGPSAWR